MYCSNCGKNLLDGAKFCSGCGKPLFFQAQSNNYVDKAIWKMFLRKTNAIIRYLGVKKLAALLSVAVFAIIILVVAWTGRKYDLSGTYQATEFFPFNQLTFDKNGHFSAVYYDESYSETYTGKYQKQRNGEYTCRFTGGSSSSGNPVLNFEASSMSEQCEITAKKVDENTLEIWIVPKIDYWAWGGKSVYFYK